MGKGPRDWVSTWVDDEFLCPLCRYSLCFKIPLRLRGIGGLEGRVGLIAYRIRWMRVLEQPTCRKLALLDRKIISYFYGLNNYLLCVGEVTWVFIPHTACVEARMEFILSFSYVDSKKIKLRL